MKILLSLIPTGALLVSCQQNVTPQETLPPVIQSQPVVTTSKPKKTVKPSSKPKVVEKKIELPDPTVPDPVKATPTVTEIPRFKVPENVQPKVTDGINQGVFLELKW